MSPACAFKTHTDKIYPNHSPLYYPPYIRMLFTLHPS